MRRQAGLGILAVACVAALFGLYWGSTQMASTEGPRSPNTPGQYDAANAATSNDVGSAADALGPLPSGDLRFDDITARAGLHFEHQVGPLGTYFMPEVNGSGGAMFDFDQDGDLDIYLINAGRSPQSETDFPPGTRVENRLFRQESDGTYADVTAESGLGDQGYGIGCAIADVDNDGDQDVYLTNYGPDRLYLNQGDGTFRDVSEEAGIANDDWATGAAFFDYDRDGRLDLFIVNYTADPEHGHSVACGYTADVVSYCSPKKFQTTVDRLLHNETVGEGSQRQVRFRDVTAEAGIETGPTYGFGLIAVDVNRDGWPDVFVASDMLPNRLWINQRDGTFRDEAVQRGVAVNAFGVAQGCMGVAVGDPDVDGDWDLAVSNLSTEGAALYANDGRGAFTDVSRTANVELPTRRHTGWGMALLDLNHDGFEDLPLVNGSVVPGGGVFPPHGEDVFQLLRKPIHNAAKFWSDYVDSNVLLINDGRGGFLDGTRLSGDFGRARSSARGLIYGDIDNDGDLDLLVTNVGERARLYQNNASKSGHWLMVQAIDPRWQRDAVGAEVTLQLGAKTLHRVVYPYMSYLASNDFRVHFGLGDVKRYDGMVVRWPDGLVEQFAGGEVDRHLRVERGNGSPAEAVDAAGGATP